MWFLTEISFRISRLKNQKHEKTAKLGEILKFQTPIFAQDEKIYADSLIKFNKSSLQRRFLLEFRGSKLEK